MMVSLELRVVRHAAVCHVSVPSLATNTRPSSTAAAALTPSSTRASLNVRPSRLRVPAAIEVPPHADCHAPVMRRNVRADVNSCGTSPSNAAFDNPEKPSVHLMRTSLTGVLGSMVYAASLLISRDHSSTNPVNMGNHAPANNNESCTHVPERTRRPGPNTVSVRRG